MDKPAPNIKLLTAITLKCWTQKELAEKAGLSQAYISRIVKGSMNPNADQRKAIARALRVQEGSVF